ncbi:nitro/flavin oxidoreductase [Vitreoscilla sp. C1]|uniref:oxygen-insensitive NADPH nitroreductase n=1 Tax=Vitreoscilla sp. (strain C1) TaxID=96942 RepID=UPI000CDCD979|nr:oxygen-insensitive NADPH nitroreductase [Vitreoscilla sp. C1]AUZ05960.1 nitro/flavin oxidoreductase [Vitreoscilla sp. C1]
MNLNSQATLTTQLHHRSIRAFTEQAVTAEICDALLAAASSGATSNFLQSTHIIRITDKHKRQQLREVCANQAYVESAPEFWVFVLDVARHSMLVENIQTDWAEVGIMGAIDAGIMAQNVLLAAESLGLGGVYIGALRNDMVKAAEILALPEKTVPLFGMCLGYPAQNPNMKPKLPTALFVSENTYQVQDLNAVAAYEAQVKAYYVERGAEPATWQDAIAKTLCKPVRPHMLPFLQQQGLFKR